MLVTASVTGSVGGISSAFSSSRIISSVCGSTQYEPWRPTLPDLQCLNNLTAPHQRQPVIVAHQAPADLLPSCTRRKRCRLAECFSGTAQIRHALGTTSKATPGHHLP